MCRSYEEKCRAVKIVLLAVLVLVLIFTGRRAYTFGYQIFAQEAMSEAPGKKVAAIRDSLSEFLWKRTKRSPMILPIIMEV